MAGFMEFWFLIILHCPTTRNRIPILHEQTGDSPTQLLRLMKKKPELGRQITVAGMAHAPTNEQGVVALFGRLAPRLGFCIQIVQVRCPDCWAIRRGKECRIEFEYYASDFRTHRHNPKDADIIVCWENDWESPPPKYRHIEIINLKKYVGALPRVFVVGCSTVGNAKYLKAYKRVQWSVPVNAQIGDLVVMYTRIDFKNRRVSEIRDLWKIVGPFEVYSKRNKQGAMPGRQGGLRRVASLKRPIRYEDLKRDPVTRDLGVVKKQFQGKTDITEYWPLLHNKILKLNPKAKSALQDFTSD